MGALCHFPEHQQKSKIKHFHLWSTENCEFWWSFLVALEMRWVEISCVSKYCEDLGMQKVKGKKAHFLPSQIQILLRCCLKEIPGNIWPLRCSPHPSQSWVEIPWQWKCCAVMWPRTKKGLWHSTGQQLRPFSSFALPSSLLLFWQSPWAWPEPHSQIPQPRSRRLGWSPCDLWQEKS